MSYRWANAEQSAVIREADGAFIPATDANRDYRALVADAIEIGAFQPYASAEAAYQGRLTELAARRWQAQLAFSYDGVDGVSYGADTAGNILAVLQGLATLDAADPGNAPHVTAWKLGRGEHRTWNASQLQTFGNALMAYIGACYANEGALATTLATAKEVSMAAVATIDLEQGWP